jgi:hypothetical protein
MKRMILAAALPVALAGQAGAEPAVDCNKAAIVLGKMSRAFLKCEYPDSGPANQGFHVLEVMAARLCNPRNIASLLKQGGKAFIAEAREQGLDNVCRRYYSEMWALGMVK